MIAAKKEWCNMCKSEHIEGMHENILRKYNLIYREKPHEMAEKLWQECLQIFPHTYWDSAYEMLLNRIQDCINVHYYLDGDSNGIGESYKYWCEVKQEAKYLKP